MKSKNFLMCLMMLTMFAVMAANAAQVTVSMGQALGVNDDELVSAVYTGGLPYINAFDHATTGNLGAAEIIIDMGQVKSVRAILMKNMPDNGFQVEEPGDLRIYIADDESAGLASSFTHEITNGRTPMDVDNRGIADAWETWTLPSVITKRYVKIDITGNGQPGQELYQFGDIDINEDTVTPITVSMGQVIGINGDSLAAAHYGSWPQTINGYDHATAGNLSALEMIVDMGQVKSVGAILMQNMPDNGYGIGEPGDVRIYVAPDESALGFNPMLASSFTQEITSGRTPMDVDYRGVANAWETWTLPSVITKRYVKIDVTGNGQPGQTVYQWQDINTQTPIPYASIGLLWGVNGDTVSKYGEDPDAAGHIIINGLNSTGTGNVNALEFVADMQSVTDVAALGIRNRAILSGLNPNTAKIYVAADESAEGFDPHNANSFTQQINVFEPYAVDFEPGMATADITSWINVTPVSRRYVRFEITKINDGPISISRYLAQWQDVLVSSNSQSRLSAGAIKALGDDAVDFDATSMIITDMDASLTADAVIDMGVVKDVQIMRSINQVDVDTLENMKNITVFVTPSSGVNSETDPSFDPLDKNNYTVEIFSGSFTPNSYLKGVEKIADVVDNSRRYLMISVSSNYWGNFGENVVGGSGYNYYARVGDIQVIGTDSLTKCSDVIELGLVLPGDLNGDCHINLSDVKLMTDEWLGCTAPNGIGCIEYTNHPTFEIPKGSGITINGNLGDWPSDSEWIWLDKVYDGFPPFDISDARMSLRWGDDNRIYVAVVVTDSNHMFIDAPGLNYADSDRIEIYSQGDAAGGTDWGVGSAIASKYFNVAQQYIVGLKTLSTGGRWAVWGDLTNVDPTALESAVVVNGNQIIYEAAVKQYNNYGGKGGGATVVTSLGVGTTVGFDVTVGTRYSNNTAFGMLAENGFTGKSNDADQFRLYELVLNVRAKTCGDWGYLSSDLSGDDCIVNFADFAAFAEKWMQCNDPADQVNCTKNW